MSGAHVEVVERAQQEAGLRERRGVGKPLGRICCPRTKSCCPLAQTKQLLEGRLQDFWSFQSSVLGFRHTRKHKDTVNRRCFGPSAGKQRCQEQLGDLTCPPSKSTRTLPHHRRSCSPSCCEVQRHAGFPIAERPPDGSTGQQTAPASIPARSLMPISPAGSRL